jgi:DNA polymerase beta
VRIARLAAVRHGMYLDEYGLWRWHSSEEAMLESESESQPIADAKSQIGNDVAVTTTSGGGGGGYWELVEGESEDRILDELELGAIAPQRRNFRFLKSKNRASARAGTLDFDLAEDPAEDGERRKR